MFLERKWCSVYLIVDELEFSNGHIVVVAYFTLSHKVLSDLNVSKSRIKEVGGDKNATNVHFVLIGQLGKFMSENPLLHIYTISAEQILNFAFEIIYAASHLIPCRCVMVECSDNIKVHNIYTNYGFKFFQYDGEHYQFYKKL